MITLTRNPHSERASKSSEVKRPSEAVETSGSLAMLYSQGLLTIGQYDEFISSNPFMVDYSAYSDDESVAYSGFLNDFANAMSTLGDSGFGGFAGFSDGGGGGGFSGASSGGFTSVC